MISGPLITKSFGAEKEEMVDGIHSFEKAYLRILLKLIEKDSVLRSFSKNEGYLRNRLETFGNSIIVFSQNEM